MNHTLPQSHLFTKTRKEAPADEVSRNAQLLIRAGYIHKEMAGVYAYLPLGIRVIEKLKDIVREEMNGIDGQELIMTSLQRKELWEKTDRWNDQNVDVWFKSHLATGGEVGFGWSHEEPIADMMRNYISSFRDLPIYVYQFQTKLRNELRAKSGIMRGKEFVMKDMYSFSLGKDDHDVFYENATQAYKRVFDRIGIGEDTFVTFAAGGAFTQFSHEFQTITEAGEDIIYINREKNIAVNEEVLNDDTLADLKVTKDELKKVSTAEVGNIFNFGTHKCEELGLTFKDSKGKNVPVWMGSYGIGITRLMGVLVEKFADSKGLVWPDAVAPFDYHVIVLDNGNEEVRTDSERLFNEMKVRGMSVLYDDRDARAGEKFADADLIGIPKRIIVSEKTLASGEYELLTRSTGVSTFIHEQELLSD